MTISILIGVFLTSLVSGWHCALMCTGFVSKSNEQIIRFERPQKMLFEYFILHGTRILTYTALGFIAGKVGTVFWLQDILPLHRAMFVLAASILLLHGLKLLLSKKITFRKLNLFSSIEKQVANLWGQFTLLASKRKTSWFMRKMQLGLVWGLVPCSLIYSALSLAFLSGSGWQGALILFAMGLGTIPNLVIISGGLGTINRWLAHVGFNPQTKIITAILLIISALWGLYQAFTLPESLLKNGFCFN